MFRPDVPIFALRIAEILTIILSVPLLWRVMLWLAWQVDCILATTAAFAFAYKFEREESQ